MRGEFAGVLVTLLQQQNASSATTGVRLQKALRQIIVDGTAREFDRLPSTRVLAAELSVARETVETAYLQLETEGFLTRRRGSGSYVAKLDRDAFVSRKLRNRPSRLQAGLSGRGQTIQARGGVRDQTVVLPFSAAMPDVKAFPLDVWRRITARVLRDNKETVLMYGDAQGYQPLRAEISRYLAAHRGVRCHADQIVVLSSSQQALSMIATLLLDTSDHLAIENPGYHGARSAFEATGVSLFPVPVDQSGLQVEALLGAKKSIRAAYVTPSHQYPTGVTLSLERRLALIDWARRSNGWIIEDDYDSEYRYDGSPISAIQGLDSHDRVLYLGTFSKMLFPSLRLAYLVVPEPLLGAFVTARTLNDGQSSLISQMVLEQFMSEGHFTAHIRRMRQLYRARRDAFMKSFADHLEDFAEPIPPAGGLHVACKLKPGITEEATAQLAASVGIELPPLRRLYSGPPFEEGWLMGFAALTPDQIEVAMRRLALALSPLRQ